MLKEEGGVGAYSPRTKEYVTTKAVDQVRVLASASITLGSELPQGGMLPAFSGKRCCPGLPGGLREQREEVSASKRVLHLGDCVLSSKS